MWCIVEENNGCHGRDLLPLIMERETVVVGCKAKRTEKRGSFTSPELRSVAMGVDGGGGDSMKHRRLTTRTLVADLPQLLSKDTAVAV